MQIVLLSAQGMSPRRIGEVILTNPDTVRDVIHNFRAYGFDSLYPRYRSGRPQMLTLSRHHEIKWIGLSDSRDLDQLFATWSLSEIVDYLVTEVVLARIAELYEMTVEIDETVVTRLDEFIAPKLRPQSGGTGWAPHVKPKWIRAPYKRLRHARRLVSASDVGRYWSHVYIKTPKIRAEFLKFCQYIRSLHPATTRLHCILYNYGPRHGRETREWVNQNNVELAYAPHLASWLNRIEAQFRALRTSRSRAPTMPSRPASSADTSTGATTTPTAPLERLVNTADAASHADYTIAKATGHSGSTDP